MGPLREMCCARASELCSYYAIQHTFNEWIQFIMIALNHFIGSRMAVSYFRGTFCFCVWRAVLPLLTQSAILFAPEECTRSCDYHQRKEGRWVLLHCWIVEIQYPNTC